MDGKQMFRQYDDFDAETFLAYLKVLHRKFSKMILFMDKARQHHRSKRVQEYLKENQDTIKVLWFPNSCPELNAVEECWRQGKDDLLSNIFYDRFIDLKTSIAGYYRTRRFRLGIVKYLLRDDR